MGDVVRAAGDRLDRRPAQPMPREIQGAHGDSAIDDPDAAKARHELLRRPILPGAGQQRELVTRAGSRERGDNLMDVLADSGAGSKGGTIVDDDPHALEPTIPDVAPGGPRRPPSGYASMSWCDLYSYVKVANLKFGVRGIHGSDG